MCLISINDLSVLKSKTLVYLTTEEHDLPYLEDSRKILVPESINDLVFEFRYLDFEQHPVVFYDDEDLSLASTAYFIFDAMECKSLVLVASRGSYKNLRPLPALNKKKNVSHIDISKISNSVLYETEEFTLNAPVVPSICNDLSASSVKSFLISQNIPTKTNEIQLTGDYAEPIGLLLRYLGNNVSVLLTEVRTRLKTMTSKGNDIFFSMPESEYFDVEEDRESQDYASKKSFLGSPNQEMITNNKVNHYEHPLQPAEPKKAPEDPKGETKCVCTIQ